MGDYGDGMSEGISSGGKHVFHTSASVSDDEYDEYIPSRDYDPRNSNGIKLRSHFYGSSTSSGSSTVISSASGESLDEDTSLSHSKVLVWMTISLVVFVLGAYFTLLMALGPQARHKVGARIVSQANVSASISEGGLHL
eukprot:GFYU01007730.1.p1 GENE.GFYU01007730.1~~GFYU01007730.1.p1  ORF type:complete len:139 (+),score=40.78 GFYU01007730.1:147-563(+)